MSKQQKNKKQGKRGSRVGIEGALFFNNCDLRVIFCARLWCENEKKNINKDLRRGEEITSADMSKKISTTHSYAGMEYGIWNRADD